MIKHRSAFQLQLKEKGKWHLTDILCLKNPMPTEGFEPLTYRPREFTFLRCTSDRDEIWPLCMIVTVTSGELFGVIQAWYLNSNYLPRWFLIATLRRTFTEIVCTNSVFLVPNLCKLCFIHPSCTAKHQFLWIKISSVAPPWGTWLTEE